MSAVDETLIAFVRCMTEGNLTADEWWYLLEKPHKWAAEYDLWVDAGKPTDPNDPAFHAFAETVEELGAIEQERRDERSAQALTSPAARDITGPERSS